MTSDNSELDNTNDLERLEARLREFPAEVRQLWVDESLVSAPNNSQDDRLREATRRVDALVPTPPNAICHLLRTAWVAFLSASSTRSADFRDHFLRRAVETLARIKDPELQNRVFAEWLECEPLLAGKLTLEQNSDGAEPNPEPPPQPSRKYFRWVVAASVAIVSGILFQQNQPPTIVVLEGHAFVPKQPKVAGSVSKATIVSGQEYVLEEMRAEMRKHPRLPHAVFLKIDKKQIERHVWRTGAAIDVLKDFEEVHAAHPANCTDILVAIWSENPCVTFDTRDLRNTPIIVPPADDLSENDIQTIVADLLKWLAPKGNIIQAIWRVEHKLAS